MTRPDLRNPRAIELLRAQLKQRGDQKRIADLFGVSHTYLSLYLANKLLSFRKLERRILAEFDRYICPHDGEQKQAADCQRRGLRPRPVGWREAEAAWLACQSCAYLELAKSVDLPKKEGEKNG